MKNPAHEGPGGYEPTIAGPAVAVKTLSPDSITFTSLRDDGTGQWGRAADGSRSRA